MYMRESFYPNKNIIVADFDYQSALFLFKNRHPELDIKIISRNDLINKVSYSFAKDPIPFLISRGIGYKKAKKYLDILLIAEANKNEELNKLFNDLNSHIWDSWADETGSIGKAYGYQLAKKSIYPEGEFDQVDRVLYDLKHNPQSRRIMTNIYNFEDLHEMGLYPCAYSMTFNVSGDTLNGILNQRSNDMLTANNWNVLQYALLLMMFAQVSGLKAGELVHVIADAHIYDRHIDLVKEVIAKPQHKAPKLKMNPNVKNFYDFKVEDFELIDYEYEDLGKKIPVAI